MKNPFFSAALFFLALCCAQTVSAQQKYFGVGGSMGFQWKENERFKFRSDRWDLHVDGRLHCIRLGLDARQFLNQKGSPFQKSRIYNGDLGFALGSFSVLCMGSYRTESLDSLSVSRSAVYVGPSLEWMQFLRGENGTFGFIQIKAAYQWGVNWQKHGVPNHLSGSQSQVTLRFGIRALPFGDGGVYPFVDLSAINLGLEGDVSRSSGGYVGLGVKVIGFDTEDED